MPELPEVQRFKRYLDANALHQTIKDLQVDTSRILEAISEKTLRPRVQGRAFSESRRHGKYLFARLADDGWLVFHMRMTGYFAYFKQREPLPRYSRVRFCFANGYQLAFCDPRNLGRIGHTRSFEGFLEEKQLGPDALSLTVSQLEKRFAGKKGTVKSALMDQKRLAGIGNLYADEILFQAGIRPQTPLPDLDDRQRQTLYSRIHPVLQTAVDKEADFDRFPSDYLLPHRKKGGICPHCGNSLNSRKVAGRTSIYCPRCQH